MAERLFLRIGAASMIVGALLALLGNGLHPRAVDPGDLESVFRMRAESAAWEILHLAILVALALILGGLMALGRAMRTGVSEAIARYARLAAVVGGTIALISVSFDAVANKRAAANWMAAPSAEKAAALRVAEGVNLVGEATFGVWIALFLGVAVLLYGLAIASDTVFPRVLGWAAVAGGAAATAIGLVQTVAGESPTLQLAFAVVSLLITVWLLVVGVILWRRASWLAAGAPSHASPAPTAH